MRNWAIAGLLATLAPAATAATLQQEFDAAQATLDRGDAGKARVLFEGLLRRMPKAAADPKNYTAAVIRAGLGQARMLIGDTRGALAAFEGALPGLRDTTPGDRQTLASVHQYIGRIYELQVDYPKAREALQRSLALQAFAPGDQATLVTQLTLARVSIFDDPGLALRTLDAALPGLEDQLAGTKPSPKRDLLGDVYALRGRVHLNRGEFAEARDWFDRGLRLAGGLGKRISVADTRIRSDLAIVHHLLGAEDKVRRYLAFTGAGRGDADIGQGADMPLPACGALTGIQPTDVAIVEFAILADGRVSGVMPIYATRPATAAEFARAVAGWSWQPETAAKLDPFWRASIRLELRCSNAGAGPRLRDGLRPTLDEWLKSKSIEYDLELTDAEALPALRSELRARVARHGEQSIQTLPILVRLASITTTDVEARVGYLEQASQIARAAGAPPEVQVVLDVSIALGSATGERTQRAWERRARDSAAALLARMTAAGQGGTLASAYVRMEMAALYNSDSRRTADALYRQVIALPASVLSEANPLRQAALLQLASSATLQRRPDEATQLVAATGLSPNQCALADVRPARVGGTITTSDFPNEALSWGFNGWVKVSYDIDVRGIPVNPRAVMAYPPFVFSNATERNIQKLRYQPFPQAAGPIGCADRLQSFRYSIP